MADPFSIIGVLAVAMDGIERATKFIEGISGAPRAIAKLDSELKAISQLLRQVQSFIHQIHVADSSVQESFIPHLQTALVNCRNVALDIESLLRPYVKPTEDPRRSTWRRIVWTLKEQKTAGLEKDMAMCKQTLNMATSFATLYVDAQSTQDFVDHSL
jgi:N-terminal domain on NACHT_NTPase and P-loop NTPases